MSIGKPEDKKPRASVACNTCRDSKLRCINKNNKNIKCQRCAKYNLPCSYTLRRSQLKKVSISRGFLDNNEESTSTTNSRLPIRPILPPKDLLLEVVDIHFENQYKGIFPNLHRPSFVAFLKSPAFDPETYIDDYYARSMQPNYRMALAEPDPVVILAILALCARLHPTLPKIYGEFSEETADTFVPNFSNRHNPNDFHNTRIKNYASNASCYFGWHARYILKEVFDSPTIQRIQALTILSSHEWGEGNSSRSLLYVGIAARMAHFLGLCTEDQVPSENDFVHREIKRRAMWSVYMMDRCNASGRQRSTCVVLDDINVQLPCQEKDFLFAHHTLSSLTFKEADQKIYLGDFTSVQNLSCFGFLIVLFDTWTKIAKWVGETGRKLELLPPWDPRSNFAILSKKLDVFERSLPVHLKFSKFNVEAHVADGSGSDFAYFHGLFFLCRIFLNREYFFCLPEGFPAGWWKSHTSVLLDTLDKLSFITQELRPINQMVVAPFTGFQIFTTAATCLYVNTFPAKMWLSYYVDSPLQLTSLQNKYTAMAHSMMKELKVWSKYWGLGKVWCETSANLQSTFARLTESKALDDDDLRHKIHDYGSSNVADERRTGMSILNMLSKEKSRTNAKPNEYREATENGKDALHKSNSFEKSSGNESDLTDDRKNHTVSPAKNKEVNLEKNGVGNNGLAKDLDNIVYRKGTMEVLNELPNTPTTNGRSEGIASEDGVSSQDKVPRSPQAVVDVVLSSMNSPSLDFINNLDFSGIFMS